MSGRYRGEIGEIYGEIRRIAAARALTKAASCRRLCAPEALATASSA